MQPFDTVSGSAAHDGAQVAALADDEAANGWQLDGFHENVLQKKRTGAARRK